MPAIWVLAEAEGDRVASSALEVATEATRIGALSKAEVVAVVLNGSAGAAAELAGHGATRVILITAAWDGADAAIPTGWLRSLVETEQPDVFLIPGTTIGREMAPRLAVALDAGLVDDCTYLRIGAGGVLEATRMEDDGAAATRLTWTGDAPALALIPPGTFRPEPVSDAAEPAVTEFDPKGSTPAAIELIGSEPIDPAQLPLDDAPVLVAGGLGVGGSDGFELLQTLAGAMGGKVAASRRATDLGWVDRDALVGQTGATVRPALYLACGISGASQHVLGMKDSGFVVSINSDPSAPIHGLADLAVVADLHDVVPELIAALEQDQ